MKLIRFTDRDENDRWINPDHIVEIYPEHWMMDDEDLLDGLEPYQVTNAVILLRGGTEIVVFELTPVEVVDRLRDSGVEVYSD